jgi:hypothetical protein
MVAPCRVKLIASTLECFHCSIARGDDPNQEDPELYIDRWRSYIASYTSVSGPPAQSLQPFTDPPLQETPTRGLTESKSHPPFLRRWDYPSCTLMRVSYTIALQGSCDDPRSPCPCSRCRQRIGNEDLRPNLSRFLCAQHCRLLLQAFPTLTGRHTTETQR